MKFINCNGDNFVTLRIEHRKGITLGELVEPPSGQISVRVMENEWSKKYQIPTHVRYFRTKKDALTFIHKTFK